MSWSTELTYFVTPKSGPMRAMRTLRDVKYALLDDLPARSRFQRHWFNVGRLLLSAADGSSRLDLMLVTDTLVMALEIEGWMTFQTKSQRGHEEIGQKPLPEAELLLAAA